MDRTSEVNPTRRKEPHEEWREALIHAWRNRRGYNQQHEAASVPADEGFIFDEP
ncbi:hypothetical protein [Komagataeibacter melaceti]|uniref:hypothetical protein n=1 Tax=Komagataeibacter melaceti TaxID=2766577 RepID=UPI001642ADC4|nr:hypothetical protein [Komagataeibacter melaceti]